MLKSFKGFTINNILTNEAKIVALFEFTLWFVLY